MKLRFLRWVHSGLSEFGLNPMTGVFISEWQRRTGTFKRSPCEDAAGMGLQAKRGRNHKKLEEVKKRFFLRMSEDYNTATSGFWSPELWVNEYMSVVLSYQFKNNLLRQLQEMNATGDGIKTMLDIGV